VMDVVDEKKYGQLLAKYLPRVIRTEEEHDRLAGLLMKLSLASERTVAEDRLIEPLERLLDDYAERRTAGKLEALDPLELLQHPMEEGGLKQVDPVDCFGSQSVVSAKGAQDFKPANRSSDLFMLAAKRTFYDFSGQLSSRESNQ